MTKVKIRPASLGEWLAFYGEQPKHTVKAIVAEADGEILGVAGLEKHPGFYVAFSDIGDKMRKHKKAILKAGKELVKLIDDCRLPVVSIQNEAEPTSFGFLTHLGFTPTEEPGVLVWPNENRGAA